MSDVRAGMTIAGKYRIEAVLARGGMGSIWRGRHLALETPVAVKFIGAEVFALKDARRRFEREARAAAQLQSAHVVHIHDYGVEGDLPYLVMELLDGEDLGVRLKRRGRLDLTETVHVVSQVARALRRAADAGIVHRDLKPSNVFLVRGDDDEELVKVLDFGVAKTMPRPLDEDTTQVGAMLGSPRYMSPEQARGSRLVDPRSDLWSLGVIAYRALTGQLPFDSHHVPDLIAKICSEPALPPSLLDAELGPEMDAFFARALDRDPAARFQTAREMAASFAVAAGLPPSSLTSFRLLTRPPSLHGELPPPSSRAGFDPRWPTASQEPAPATALAPTRTGAPPSEPAPPSPRETDPTRVSRLSPTPSPPPPRSPFPSTTLPEPAASRRATQLVQTISTLPDGTLTQHPGWVDVSLQRSVRPPRPWRARTAALVALAALAGGVLVAAPWRRSAPAAGGLPPPEPCVSAVPPVAPEPVEKETTAATAATIVPVTATAEPTAAPLSPHRRRLPANRAVPRREHPDSALGY